MNKCNGLVLLLVLCMSNMHAAQESPPLDTKEGDAVGALVAPQPVVEEEVLPMEAQPLAGEAAPVAAPQPVLEEEVSFVAPGNGLLEEVEGLLEEEPVSAPQTVLEEEVSLVAPDHGLLEEVEGLLKEEPVAAPQPEMDRFTTMAVVRGTAGTFLVKVKTAEQITGVSFTTGQKQEWDALVKHYESILAKYKGLLNAEHIAILDELVKSQDEYDKIDDEYMSLSMEAEAATPQEYKDLNNQIWEAETAEERLALKEKREQMEQSPAFKEVAEKRAKAAEMMAKIDEIEEQQNEKFSALLEALEKTTPGGQERIFELLEPHFDTLDKFKRLFHDFFTRKKPDALPTPKEKPTLIRGLIRKRGATRKTTTTETRTKMRR